MNILLRLVLLAAGAVIISLLIWAQNHRIWTISPLDSKLYAFQLTGVKSVGVPVIVFTSDECSACKIFEQKLKSAHIDYIRADTDRNETAVQLQDKVGLVTPTTIVGTKVIVGCDTKKILSELSTQRLNRDFYQE